MTPPARCWPSHDRGETVMETPRRDQNAGTPQDDPQRPYQDLRRRNQRRARIAQLLAHRREQRLRIERVIQAQRERRFR
jgi:hypothetical protein